MPEMVVVSVLPEKEDVLHPVAWCCPLPCAALRILWIRRICFIAKLAFTCDHSLVGFPVAVWQHQLKIRTEVLPQCLQPVVWDGCPVSPAGCHLCSVCLTLMWHWSGPCGIFLLFPQSFRPASSCPCLLGRLGVGGRVVVPVPGLTLLPYLQCRRSWGGAQPDLHFCSLLVRWMSKPVLKSVGLRRTASCVLGVTPSSQWLWGTSGVKHLHWDDG